MLCVERVFGLFVEFVLKFEAGVVGFDGAECFDDGANPAVEIPLAEFFHGDGAIAGIVIREAGVPPDASVNVLRKLDAGLVGAGFLFGAIEMNEIRMRDQSVGGFVFAGVIVNAGRFLGRTARAAALSDDGVDNVVVRLVELRLGEEWDEAFVAAVAVDDEDFLAAITRHFVGGFLEEHELEVAAVSDGTGFVLRFKNLTEIVFRKDDGVFLLDRMERGVADVEEIGAERKMRAVFFKNAEGKNANAFGLSDGVAEVGCGEFLPFWRKLGLSR